MPPEADHVDYMAIVVAEDVAVAEDVVGAPGIDDDEARGRWTSRAAGTVRPG